MIISKRYNKVNDDFRELIQLLDIDLDSCYGNLQKIYNQFNNIESINNMIIAYFGKLAVGCGCYKKYDNNTVESKRMFVNSNYRGKGIASSILDELESWACENGYNYEILETGIKQHEAVGLYHKKGYSIVENYSQYAGNSNSVCTKKSLKRI